jgi:hypothetical protein
MASKMTRREAVGGGLLVPIVSMITLALERLTHEDCVPVSYLKEQTAIWMAALRQTER